MVMIFQVKLVHIAGLLVCIPLSVHRIWDVHSIHSLMFERIPTSGISRPFFPPYDEDDDDYNDDKEKESSDDYADNGRDRAG